MAQPLSLQDQHRTTFYAPAYRLEVGGKQLHEKGGDVLSIQFKDSIKDLSAMEIVLNNLDDDGKRQARYKYSDGGTLIELGRRFELSMGYADAPGLSKMMVGEITSFDPHFPASGAPTVTVRGLDRLHRLRNRPVSFTWENQRDSDIAKAIAKRNGLDPAVVDETSPTHKAVPQDNRDDVSFLLERAKRLDFEVFVKDDKLHFVHSREGGMPILTLALGQSLLSFEPSLTLSRMVSKVTVRCWHPEEGRLIEKSAERSKLNEIAAGKKNAGAFLEDVLGQGKEEVVTTQGVLSDEDAAKLAEAILRRKAHSFVTGQGQTVGIPTLRAGANIELRGLGKRFDGVYYVTESTHRIDASGYQTSFAVRKAYVDSGR